MKQQYTAPKSTLILVQHQQVLMISGDTTSAEEGNGIVLESAPRQWDSSNWTEEGEE